MLRVALQLVLSWYCVNVQQDNVHLTAKEKRQMKSVIAKDELMQRGVKQNGIKKGNLYSEWYDKHHFNSLLFSNGY
jgi:uncharacterized protein YcnI